MGASVRVGVGASVVIRAKAKKKMVRKRKPMYCDICGIAH